MRALRRVAVACTVAVVLIAVALAVTVWNFRRAVTARQLAVAAVGEVAATRAAEADLAREREEVDEYLLRPRAQVLDEIREHQGTFAGILAGIGAGEPNERRLARRATAANNALLAAFFAQTHVLDPVVPDPQGLQAKLDPFDEATVAPLDRLRAVNVVQQRKVERDAAAANWRALVSAIVAGVLAVAAALGFALYAARLLGEIESRNTRLRELDRLKDDFVASVSHELRTPLTSIRGYLELLLDGEAGDLTDEQERFLRIVERNADRLLRVVGDLLFVAQADAGRIALEPAPLDLDELALESVDAVRPIAAEKDVSLSLDLGGLGELEGDRARLSQVLDNLLSNAVKFTPPGGHVLVRTIRHGDAAMVEVCDDGMGLAAEELGQLFTRFFRARGATEHGIQGTGLGLAIVKAITEAHGGAISVESVPGRGTTFRVELPLILAEVAA
jgi:signal transduction histidine kinase